MDQVMEVNVYRPRPVDLPAFLPFACGQLEAPFHVIVLVEVAEEYVKSEDKGKKSKREKAENQAVTSTTQYSSDKQDTKALVAQQYGDMDEVIVRALCDSAGRPMELVFYRCPQIPRLLLKILGLCIPFHQQLTKITIRWAPLDGFALYEIAKFLPLSQITEICLDDSPASQHSYQVLLERHTQLRCLSIARCNLTDDDVVSMAKLLTHPQPASRMLNILSLESNLITDEGARALGEALRTNRSLRHLNLAGNRITNRGVGYIYCSLVPFPVSEEEMILKRKRTLEYLKTKRETYERCLEVLSAPTDTTIEGGRRRTKTFQGRSRRGSAVSVASMKVSAADALVYRAEMMANELVGPCLEPFAATELVTRNDGVYCVGNFSLCYLNLAYNELDCIDGARLVEVLAYQAEARRSLGGLLRVVLEGSRMDSSCAAARTAALLLERNVSAAAAADAALQPKPTRKGERAKIKT